MAFSASVLILYCAFPSHRGSSAFSVALFSVLVYLSRYLLDLRPVLLTILCIAIFIWSLERFRISGQRRYLWIPAIVQVFWVNSQGLFVLGIVIVLLYLVGEWLNCAIARKWPASVAAESILRGRDLWTLATAAPLLAVVSLINPYGIRGLLLPLELFHRIDPSLKNIFAYNISENLPLVAMISSEPHYVIAVAFFALAGLLLFILNARRVRFAHVFVFLCFLALAWMAKRNIILFFMAAAPVLAHYTAMIQLPKGLNGRMRPLLKQVVLICSIALSVAFTAAHARVLVKHAPGTWIAPFSVPEGAVEYLKKNSIHGNMFNSDRFGGYISWKMYPPQKTYIDDRLVIRPRQFFADYLEVLDNPEQFDGVVKRWGITHVVLQTAVFDRYMKLARSLYADSSWKLLYADGVSTVFGLADSVSRDAVHLDSLSFAESVLHSLALRWKGQKNIYNETAIYLGIFLLNMGSPKNALEVFNRIPAVEAMPYREYCTRVAKEEAEWGK
jgi:hypothetical protein